MKRLNALILLSPIILVIFLFTSCDMEDNPVGTFGDIMNKVPRFEPIDGAGNVTVRVTDDGVTSTFKVNISNLGANTPLYEGDYIGWCGLWQAPIGSDGREYNGVTIYSTLGDKNFNNVNYLLNKRRTYENTIEDVTHREIQAALWLLLKYKEYNIDEDTHVNRVAVNKIMADINLNGINFVPGAGQISAVFADLSIHATNDFPTQTVLLEVGTAMARMFDDQNDLTYQFPGHAWFTYLKHEPDGTASTFYMYSGNVPSERVGIVNIWKDASNLYVQIVLDADYYMSKSDVHVALSLGFFGHLPGNQPDWAFGHYLSQKTNDPVADTDTHTIAWDSDWDGEELIIAVHADVYKEVEI
jgi:hypothetical protein